MAAGLAVAAAAGKDLERNVGSGAVHRAGMVGTRVSAQFSRVLGILKRAGVRLSVVFHDVEPFTGPRFIDRLRRSAQLRAMQRRWTSAKSQFSRSSAIAGIACGLPVIAAEGPETSSLIKDAGVALYSPQNKGDWGEVLPHVLEDEHYCASLAQRSWIAQQRYFSWNVIAGLYAEFLQKKD